ncbi:MAG: hypothetical protein R3E39_16915 [Anaerolineae bacterium]
MAARQVKLIASNSQEITASDVPDVKQVLEENLRNQYEFMRKRIQTALSYATAAGLGVLIALLIASALNLLGSNGQPVSYRLYGEYLDWRSVGVPQFSVCEWNCEIGIQVTRLISAAQDIGSSVVSDDGIGNAAGIARLCTLIAVCIVAWTAYRRQLPERYELNVLMAQLDDFNTLPRWQFWLCRFLYTAATLFGTYVVSSVVWFMIAQMFKNMPLNSFDALVVVVLFTTLATYIAAYGALALSTRDVLMLAMFIFFIGFAVSFALAPEDSNKQQWWERAVSNAGQLNPSAPLFTGTLLCGSLMLIVLWFDIDSIILKMVRDGDLRFFGERGWMRVARVLYGALAIGLISVGFIRVDAVNFRFNMVFHAGGAVLAILSVVFSSILIRKRRFHPWYKIFSVYILLGLTFGMGFLGSLKPNPPNLPSFVFPGTGLISLTVIELALFGLIGLWIYLTIDNLLGQANINAFEGDVVMVSQ